MELKKSSSTLNTIQLLEFQGNFSKYSGEIELTGSTCKIGHSILKATLIEPKYLYKLDKNKLQLTAKVSKHYKFTQRPSLEL